MDFSPGPRRRGGVCDRIVVARIPQGDGRSSASAPVLHPPSLRARIDAGSTETIPALNRETKAMDSAMHEKIVAILSRANDLTLATVRPDGYPQATTVGYVNDGVTLYFG